MALKGVASRKPKNMRRFHNLNNMRHGANITIPERVHPAAPESAKKVIRNERRKVEYQCRKIFKANPHLRRDRDHALVHMLADQLVRVRRINTWMREKGLDVVSPEADDAIRKLEAYEQRIERLHRRLKIDPASDERSPADGGLLTENLYQERDAERNGHAG